MSHYRENALSKVIMPFNYRFILKFLGYLIATLFIGIMTMWAISYFYVNDKLWVSDAKQVRLTYYTLDDLSVDDDDDTAVLESTCELSESAWASDINKYICVNNKSNNKLMVVVNKNNKLLERRIPCSENLEMYKDLCKKIK